MRDAKSMQFLGIGASFSFINIVDLIVLYPHRGYWMIYVGAQKLPMDESLSKGVGLKPVGLYQGAMSTAQVLQHILTNEHNQFFCDSTLLKPRRRLPHQKPAQSWPFASLYSKLSLFLGYGMPSICKYCGFMEDSCVLGWGLQQVLSPLNVCAHSQ